MAQSAREPEPPPARFATGWERALARPPFRLPTPGIGSRAPSAPGRKVSNKFMCFGGAARPWRREGGAFRRFMQNFPV